MADGSSSGTAVETGLHVIVTRPADQAGPWVDALGRLGIAATAVPLIGIEGAADPAPVDAAWAELAALGLVVFVSPNAATRFFARRPAGQTWPGSVHAASPGPGTSEVLRAFGVPPHRLVEPAADAAQFDSESLWSELRMHPWQGARVLIVRGENGRGWLADQLTAAGAQVQFLSAYQRGPARLDAAAREVLRGALVQPRRHLWFFSSSEAVDHLLAAELAPADELRSALLRATALATHPRIAERARSAGFDTVLHCRPSLAAVVACIQSQPSLNPLSALRTAP